MHPASILVWVMRVLGKIVGSGCQRGGGGLNFGGGGAFNEDCRQGARGDEVCGIVRCDGGLADA